MIRQAAILCGGLETRHGAVAEEKPKPLPEVGGAPFLDTLLFELGRYGVRRVLLLAGHAAQQITDYAVSTPMKALFGLEIDVSRSSRNAPARAGQFGTPANGWMMCSLC